MSGIPPALRARLAADPFARRNGIELLDVGPGFARVAMTVAEDMVNIHGSTHGGALFTLADAAFAAASNSHGMTAVALTMTVAYHAATGPGDQLEASATELHRARRTATYEIVVRRGAERIATLQATVYRTEKPVREA
ncbi:MAG: hydroxyphenylacetyl-CoA thioesterase PaaI [Ardenticatenaceae bacterium]|nr:hydroxyphenylacetyl-CoA thioesterase PaaI [Ardenticatenaceae bacterium]